MPKDSSLPDAAFDDDVKKVKALVASGAALESLDESGQTALVNAAMNGNLALVKFLLGKGANAKHASRRFKDGAIHAACESGAPAVVAALLDAGADVNAKGFSGLTPLHLAVDRKHAEVVALLLARGADPKRKNALGKTPAADANPRMRKVLESGVAVAAAKQPRAKAAKVMMPPPPATRFLPLASLAAWQKTKSAARLVFARALARELGSDWEATGAFPGKHQFAELRHVPTTVRFAAVPAGAFLAGLRVDEIALAESIEWQEESTSLGKANAKPGAVAAGR